MVDVDRDSSALFVSRLLARVIGFVSVAYFTWKVGAAGFGIYITFQTVVRVSGTAAQFGLPAAVTKRVSQARDVNGRGRVLTAALVMSIVPFALISVIVLALGPRLTGYVELAATVPLMILAVGLAIVNSLLHAGLRGENRVWGTAIAELVMQVVRVSASVALLVNGYDALGLVWGEQIGVMASILVAYLLLNTGITFSRPSRESLDNLFGFSKYTIGMNVSELAYSWADTLVLAALASKAVVGAYEVGWQLSLVTLMAAQVIGISIMPAMTTWHENGAIERVERAFRTSLTFSLILVIPALVGALIVGEELFRVVYGIDEYAVEGATVLVILLVGQLSQAVKQVTQNTLLGVDCPTYVFWTNALTLGTNVGLNLLLIPEYGMVGAAAATASTATVAAVSQMYYLRRYIDLSIDVRSLVWEVAAALAMGAAVYGLGTVVSPGSAIGLAISVGGGVVVYGLCVVINPTIRKSVSRAKPW